MRSELSVDPTSTDRCRDGSRRRLPGIADQVGELRVRWSDELGRGDGSTRRSISVIDTVESAADEAARTRRELVVEARLAADQATATTIDRLSADLRHLTDTDSELAERVGGVADALTETDASLAEAVRDLELMMANDICHSRHYILTFDSKTGPVGRLIDVLTTHPDFHNDYDFRHYTANARFGTMPEGMTFEEFHENLTADIAASSHTVRSCAKLRLVVGSRPCPYGGDGGALRNGVAEERLQRKLGGGGDRDQQQIFRSEVRPTSTSPK